MRHLGDPHEAGGEPPDEPTGAAEPDRAPSLANGPQMYDSVRPEEPSVEPMEPEADAPATVYELMLVRSAGHVVVRRAKSIARKFPRLIRDDGFMSCEDLEQIGTMALFRAARAYRKEENTEFPAYAKFYVRGAMLDALDDLLFEERVKRAAAKAEDNYLAQYTDNDYDVMKHDGTEARRRYRAFAERPARGDVRRRRRGGSAARRHRRARRAARVRARALGPPQSALRACPARTRKCWCSCTATSWTSRPRAGSSVFGTAPRASDIPGRLPCCTSCSSPKGSRASPGPSWLRTSATCFRRAHRQGTIRIRQECGKMEGTNVKMLRSNGENVARVYAKVELRASPPEPVLATERVQIVDPRNTSTLPGGPPSSRAAPRNPEQKVFPAPKPPGIELPDALPATKAQRVLLDPELVAQWRAEARMKESA